MIDTKKGRMKIDKVLQFGGAPRLCSSSGWSGRIRFGLLKKGRLLLVLHMQYNGIVIHKGVTIHTCISIKSRLFGERGLYEIWYCASQWLEDEPGRDQ